jgi:mannose-6-phosphate isomerase-like protein (cupin superfamily)
MKPFPAFFTTDADRVKLPPDANMQGFVFDGAGGVQVVFWQCPAGGVQGEQVHDFWEYALVVEGTFDGVVGGKAVHLERGDECVIPPGTPHSGRYSTGYRAIDAFSAHRVDRAGGR